MSGQTNQKGDAIDAAHADSAGNAPSKRAPEEITQALTQLEACFTGLKSLHLETANREADLTRRASEIERLQEEASRLIAQAELKQKELLDREAAAEQTLRAAEAERADAESQVALVQLERERITAEKTLIDKSAAELRARETAATKERESASRKLAQAQAEAEKSKAAAALVARRVEEAERAAAEAQAKAVKAEGEAARARAEAAESAETDDLRARLAAASAALAAQQAEAAHLRAEHEEVEQQLRMLQEQPPPADADSAEELAKHVRAIEALDSQLETSRTRISSLENQLRSNASRPGSSAELAAEAERVMVRRSRLTRYKALLQAQARKIVQAQAALSKRHTECDQVMAQRSKLALAASDLQRREAAVARAKSRSTSAAIMFYCAASLVVLGGLSWGIAKQIAPATFVARAVIEADPKGRGVNDEQLGQWQQYHESLLQDPQLMEIAAERLQRRGITSVGTAPALRERIIKDLFAQSANPGSLTIELKGDGAQKTSDILDTFVTTLVSTSNAGRGQRPDGIATSITKAATPDAIPLDNLRAQYALGILGGGAVLFGFLGVVICSRLRKAKLRMEADSTLDEALDEHNWQQAA